MESDRLDEAAGLCRSLLHGDSAVADPAIRSAAWHNLAAVARQRGRRDEAAAWQQCSVALAMCGSGAGRATLPPQDLGGLALDALERGELELAEDLLRRSLRIEVTRGDAVAQAADWGNLGVVFWIRGDRAAATDCFAMALDLHRSAGHVRGIGADLMNLSQVRADAGGWREAAGLLEQALRQLGANASPLLTSRAEALLAEARHVVRASDAAGEN